MRTSVPTAPRVAFVCLVTIGVLTSCHAAQLPSADAARRPTKADRLSDISRAKIWAPTNVAAMDIRTGPNGKGAFEPFARVSCDYVDKKMSGASPKFACALDEKDEVKIKYGAHNQEVYAEVASSRLLWALGFGADSWYPVSVTCHRCPDDPHRDHRPTERDVTFEIAALERPAPGHKIETREDEGWSWADLDLVKEVGGGAPVEQRDALKLLAVFLQHTDNKDQQQRLVCLDGGHVEPCPSPFMYLHDVGLTFGKASLLNRSGASSANFDNWTKAGIWADRDKCIGNLPRSLSGSLNDPVIHEAGRKFLADLLDDLSDAQLRDLFEVARFPQYSGVSVDRWVALFKSKRDEIANTTCRN
ncbi:MAG TPA: hypothetical protein VJN96_24895 [Vicinamibacterales bacterium]|nr:hypothetical protein [Vicinamibacterales bacterium]